MPDPFALAVLVAGALVGSVVGGAAGFGTGLILLPLVAWTLGIKATGPVLTVAMLLGNISRVWWSRHDLDPGVAVRFLAGAVPATALVAMLYAGLGGEWLARIIGVFLVLAVPVRRLLLSGRLRVGLATFPPLGVGIGALSALVVTTGPIAAPFFLAYGLRRGAYIATEGICAFAMHATRGVVFARYSLISGQTLLLGLLLGSVMFAGSWLGRRLLDRMSDRTFLVLVEALLVTMGLQFLLLSR
ncbi:MAG: sulfite exporter TauE/SafE family protein [Candidatus Rokubacteria bacterium]|nr:sulfite exporter TauE/SafE family protein [Candidatus Rokubacteria bacterium]MBI3827109.1 sulfite exporter TauE/SafE family protein [Candidatus Rokubacteria bacterium]